MRLFTEFFQLFIDFIVGIFNSLNELEIVHNGRPLGYGWLLLSAGVLLIITNAFWRGGQK